MYDIPKDHINRTISSLSRRMTLVIENDGERLKSWDWTYRLHDSRKIYIYIITQQWIRVKVCTKNVENYIAISNINVYRYRIYCKYPAILISFYKQRYFLFTGSYKKCIIQWLTSRLTTRLTPRLTPWLTLRLTLQYNG